MDETTAKVSILFHGDPSVGIFPYSYEMTIPRVAIEDFRDETINMIQELYFQLDGEQRPEIIIDEDRMDQQEYDEDWERIEDLKLQDKDDTYFAKESYQ
jgi:hypothetical protein